MRPAHQGMEPIQEGASEAGTDAHTEDGAEESTPQQTPQNSPGGRTPYGCVQAGSALSCHGPAKTLRQSRFCAFIPAYVFPEHGYCRGLRQRSPLPRPERDIIV